MDLLEPVSHTIETRGLLESGDAVLVALSGGPDSVALLHLLSRLWKEFDLTLGAVYINHQIRKRAAKLEERFCQALCDKLKVPLTIVREDIPELARSERKSVEETARDYRYATFERIAKDERYTKVALGHHVDDRVETILFRITRGTGRTGLVGMPVKRGKIIRPLFDVSKEQILEYLRRRRLGYCVDQSNQKSEYSRNFIRNKLVPQIKKRLNPQIERAVLNLSETLDAEEKYLDDQALKAFRRATRRTPGGKIELDVPAFSKYTVWLRRRVLRHCLGSVSGQVSIDRETIERLDRFIRSDAAGCSLPGRVEVTRLGQKVALGRRGTAEYAQELAPGKRVRLKGLGVGLTCKFGRLPEGDGWKKPRARKVYLDWGKVEPPLRVRPIQPGDRFQPMGLRGTKKISDYLTDRKVPKIYRNEIPVVEDRRGIIWLVGYEIADRVKVGKTTGKVVTLEVVIEQGYDT